MSDQPNVLWIVVDCLRNDALSATGYDRPTTEVIDDRLERDFVSFTDTATQSGFTLSVLSSMLTGAYPSTHGVLRWDDHFPNEMQSYNDAVRDTHLAPVEAISGMNFITDEWGLNEEFADVHNLSDAKSERDCHQAKADEVCATTRDVIQDRDQFNLFLWFFDLHDPWLSDRRFYGENDKRDRYDSELAFVSEQLTRLFNWLETQALYKDTIIIVTGDHGDIFSEYGRLPWSRAAKAASKLPKIGSIIHRDGYGGHLGRPLFEEILNVPLFIKFPDQEFGGDSVDGQVELIDILPTVLNLGGLTAAYGRGPITVATAKGWRFREGLCSGRVGS